MNWMGIESSGRIMNRIFAPTLTVSFGDRTVERTCRPTYRPDIKPETLTDGRTVYVATHPSLAGVIAQGDTAEDAMQDYREVFAIYRDHLREYKMPLPRSTKYTFGRITL